MGGIVMYTVCAHMQIVYIKKLESKETKNRAKTLLSYAVSCLYCTYHINQNVTLSTMEAMAILALSAAILAVI